jgi:hypothetical protein
MLGEWRDMQNTPLCMQSTPTCCEQPKLIARRPSANMKLEFGRQA